MRLRFMFWLDLEIDEEYQLAETIEDLKERRKFAPTIRDGIRLICELRQKQTGLLETLFPWIAEHYRQKYSGEISNKLESINQHLQNLPAGQGGGEAPQDNSMSLTRRSSSPAASLDDIADGLEVKTASKDEDNKSNWNFAISSALAVFGSVDNLPDEVIRYGLRTSRIQPHQLTRTLKTDSGKSGAASKEPPKPASNGNAKMMAGADIEFTPPDFDDDDLLSLTT